MVDKEELKSSLEPSDQNQNVKGEREGVRKTVREMSEANLNRG